MFAALKRLGVLIVFAALAFAVPSTALAGSALARELAPYRAGLVLAKPGAGPALREAGGVKIASALPIWRVPTRSALQALPGLLSSGLVSEVTPDQPLSTLQAPPAEGTDWWIPFVHADSAVPPGPGKPLTIIDTGVDLTHEEFAGRPFTTALNRQSTTGQNEEHGTAVASVAAAPRNSLGVVGVYPQANLYLWDASPAGIGITAGDVIRGLDAAIHLGPGVVNLSLGSEIRNPLIDRMVAVTQGAGVLIVAAAGNSRQNGNPAEYPASLPHVLTVGSLDSNAMPSFFTTGSPHVDLSAPGERIWVAVPTTLHPPDNYDQFDGTSFASPMVAAAADWVWTVRAGARRLTGVRHHARLRTGHLDAGLRPSTPASGGSTSPQRWQQARRSARPAGAERGRLVHQAGRHSAPGSRAPDLRGPEERENLRTPRPGRRSARRVPLLGAARERSLGRTAAVRRRRRPGALGAEDRERARDRTRPRKRDSRGVSERSGTKRDRLRVRNTTGRSAYFYAEATYAGGNANSSRHPAGNRYVLSVSIVNAKQPARR